MIGLLTTFSWQDLRHNPWRSLAAVAAVMLGVALAFAVHAINASALDEFSQAVRSVNGQPDLEVRAMHGQLPQALYGALATHPEVARAAPVLEASVLALQPDGSRTALRLVGSDALVLPAMAPTLMPQGFADHALSRTALFAPATVYLNSAALQALGISPAGPGKDQVLPRRTLQFGLQTFTVTVAGTLAAGGPPLAFMDIGAAQDLLGRNGDLSRIDLQLQAGADRARWVRQAQGLPDWPPHATVSEPGDTSERISNLSRAYRVNLTVLALVALVTGAFLVFSVLALSVSRRAPQFALLAVLGATPRERLTLVLVEAGLLGLAGSVSGIALGTGLAAAALRLLGGDLGGGYFAGVQPALQWSLGAAVLYGALGMLAALVGGWWPARAAERLPPAATLKGLGVTGGAGSGPRVGIILIAAGALLACAPPIFGIPLAAYVAVALLLVGGIVLLPPLVDGLLARLHPLVAYRPLPLLALERARRMRGTAAVAVGGVVAALSLAVALTVMVASFRGSVMQWLDAVLPSPLYMRLASGGSGSAAGDAALMPPELADAVAALPELERVHPLRASLLQLEPHRPPLTVLSRPLEGDAARYLPLVGSLYPVPPGATAVYVSEAVVDLYGVRPGSFWQAFSRSFSPQTQYSKAREATFFIAGVWRDYARQSGTVAMDRADYLRLTGDGRVSDLALWPREGVAPGPLQAQLQAMASPEGTSAAPLEFVSSRAIRERSLQIFDRSFAVTYWLQAVAIGIGLFGVAASFSAQVLARRKEFGLLAHLGLTRRQILAVVAGEGAAWTGLGAMAGVLSGLAIAVVLVHVVNPQSFHWTMELQVPIGRLLALCAAVMASGTLTAWLAGRAAAGQDAVMAVKEDW